MKRTILSLVFGLSATLWAVGGDMGVSTEPLTDGSAAHPWIIEDLADFDAFATTSAYWAAGVHTKLTTDIDLSGRTYTTAVIAHMPGFWGPRFEGVFEGNDFTISNLLINSCSVSVENNHFVGLFSAITGANARVKNLGIKDIDIIGGSTSGLIGALAGENFGSIMNCWTTGVVNGGSYVGGLVGYNRFGSVTNCYSIGNASGSGNVGGLLGANDRGCVINCFSIVDIDSGSCIGGIVAFNHGSITNCYATGDVCGGFYDAGGLVGQNGSGSITNCYATGDVSGNFNTGGLVGYHYSGSLMSCYATGKVNGNSEVGGLLGYLSDSSALIENNAWDIESSGTAIAYVIRISGGVKTPVYSTLGVAEGKTTTEMMTQDTFTGWDFTTPVWMMLREGEDYPRLAWQEVFTGDVAGLYGVDMVDLAYMGKHWGLDCAVDNCGRADIGTDGEVGLEDLGILASQWLEK